MNDSYIGGIHIHYLAVCKRKLWFYDKGIAMELESDRVLEGTVLHNQSYQRLKQREILIDNQFKIDAIDGDYVREVKISSKMTAADKLQMLFYLYQLELRGIVKKGLVSYTREKRTETIELNQENRRKIKKAIAEAFAVTSLTTPPSVKKLPYCKSCAYFPLCYASEEGE